MIFSYSLLKTFNMGVWLVLDTSVGVRTAVPWVGLPPGRPSFE